MLLLLIRAFVPKGSILQVSAPPEGIGLQSKIQPFDRVRALLHLTLNLALGPHPSWDTLLQTAGQRTPLTSLPPVVPPLPPTLTPTQTHVTS